jgi:hypothetical protein
MNTRRLWIFRIVLLTFSIAVAVAALEVAVRVAGLDAPLMWEPDRVLGWRNIPGSQQRWTEEGTAWVEINALGLRDPERVLAKPAGVFRIAVMGDSMTQAVQVDGHQTFCQLLEERLRQRGLNVEVLNFGVNGYGPLQEYLLFSEYARQFQPDLVLHAVFLDNDIADSDPRLAVGQGGAPFLQRATPGFAIDSSAAVASYEGYHREPVYTVRRLSALYRMMSARRYDRIRTAAFQTGLGDSGQVPKRYLLYARPPAPEWQDAWTTFERVVEQFAESVRGAGARYAMVAVPAGQIVNDEAWQELQSRFPAMAAREWSRSEPEMRLREIAGRRGVELVSPFDAFAAHPERTSLFFGQVGHFTPRGHQVMAAALDAALQERGLLAAESE